MAATLLRRMNAAMVKMRARGLAIGVGKAYALDFESLALSPLPACTENGIGIRQGCSDELVNDSAF